MTAPQIDFSGFRGTVQARRQVAETICEAAATTGFFYLVGTGIEARDVREMIEASRAFFDQSDESKLARRWNGKMPVIGYVPREREALDESRPPDRKEAFNVPPPDGELDPAEVDRVWASAPGDLRQVAEGFAGRCFELGQQVLGALALGLDLPEDWFTRGHRAEDQTLRLLHYFPVEQGLAPRQLGAGDHSDHGTLTLLFQDQIGGLEYLDRAAGWTTLEPIEGAVLVNAGDLLARWTGGAVRSAPHRVLVTARHRYSLAYFLIPRSDVELTCPATSVLPGNAEAPSPMTAEEFLLLRSLRRTERFYRHHPGLRSDAEQLPKGLLEMRNLVAQRLSLDAEGLDRRLAEFGFVDYRHAEEA